MNTDTIVLCYRRHLVACDNGIGFTPRKLVLCGATTNFYNPRQHLSNKEKGESIIKLLILKLASDALNQNTTSIQESELFADHAKLQPTRSTGRKVPYSGQSNKKWTVLPMSQKSPNMLPVKNDWKIHRGPKYLIIHTWQRP